MFCWKEYDILVKNRQQGPSLEDVEGTPMSVQQAYAEMIGNEGLTLERYQVRFVSRGYIESVQLSCAG
jgi:tRNA-splicing endonuclease subunit Sen54